MITIDGGVAGAEVVHGCALRGLHAISVECHGIATGATGRNHDLLHSGAYYVVTDTESVRECTSGDQILRRIVRHCVESTDGLFITLPEDKFSFQATFIRACEEAGICTEVIGPQRARIIKPSVNPQLIGVVKIPDGTVNPFRLTTASILDACEHGVVILTTHEVMGLIREDAAVCGVNVCNHPTDEIQSLHAPIVVSATRIWGRRIAECVGLSICILLIEGPLLIMDHHINQHVINRCRRPSDVDILVSGDAISLIGTTSQHIGYDDIDSNRTTAEEVDILLREDEKLASIMTETRILCAYSDVCPLVAGDDDPSSHNVSCGIVLFDHAERDGLEGFIAITGGKLTTYRLMMGRAADTACRKLGNIQSCTMADTAPPGPQGFTEHTLKRVTSLPALLRDSMVYRYGGCTPAWLSGGYQRRSLVCECEAVIAGEVQYAVKNLTVNSLFDLRCRTRVGMGTCQGELCTYHAAGLLQCFNITTAAQSITQLSGFLNERWRGA